MLKIVKILNFFSLILLVLLSNIFVSVYANTLQDVKDRGYLLCGVSENFIGFASPNDKGEWEGFDVDFCRAVAVAVFGDLNKVKFIPTTYEEFENVSNKVNEGTYDYNIIEYQKFSVKNYKNWLKTIDRNKRFNSSRE